MAWESMRVWAEEGMKAARRVMEEKDSPQQIGQNQMQMNENFSINESFL
jgi:hypothetical protein